MYVIQWQYILNMSEDSQCRLELDTVACFDKITEIAFKSINIMHRAQEMLGKPAEFLKTFFSNLLQLR